MNLSKRGFLVLLIIEILFILQICLLASASMVFHVQHKFAGKNKSLTEFKAHDSDRHRRLLSAVHLPIGGDRSPTSESLYFTKIQIGTPRKDYRVQIDTGSDILWVNCVGCQKCPTKSRHGKQPALYDPKDSSSSKIVTCDQDICKSTLRGSISPCNSGMQCTFSVKYGDGSTAKGYYVVDTVQLDRVSGDRKTTSINGSIAFGCGSQQSGDLGSSDQSLDGILGFGQASSSMLSQLASANKVKKIFSHCLDGSKGGGIFTIGEVVHPKIQTTPMIPGDHYNVGLKSIDVGGQVLQLPTDIFNAGDRQGTIIDTGTTLAYLPDLAYNELLKKINAAQPKIKSHMVDNQFTCYKYMENVDKGFPTVTFHFQNSLSLKVYPHQYLFEVEKREWCIGFQDSDLQTDDGKDITLLGDLVLTDKLVTYDVEQKTIGWIEHKCSSSIKVKDDESRKAYKVHAIKLSDAGCIGTPTGMIVAFFLFLMIISNLH